MKCIVAGCRHIIAEQADALVWDAINASGWSGDITEIFHGGARGIDAAADRVCEGVWPVHVFKADWTANGVAAGPVARHGQHDPRVASTGSERWHDASATHRRP